MFSENDCWVIIRHDELHFSLAHTGIAMSDIFAVAIL